MAEFFGRRARDAMAAEMNSRAFFEVDAVAVAARA